MFRMKIFVFFFLISATTAFSQIPEACYAPNIKSVQLFPSGNQLGYPVIRLGAIGQMELHFDVLGGDVGSYSYTFQLCNADWTPAMLSHFDFIKGFSQARISDYHISSVAYTRYTHYRAVLPERNCVPSRSGNYILKVFLDGDTSNLVFTKRMLVVEDKSSIAAQIQQPYNGQLFHTHQKVQFKVSLNDRVDVVNAQQQIKVAILQNNRWDNAVTGIRPTFFSRKVLEYNTENDAVFAAGKEWRWLDIRSFRLRTDRVADIQSTAASTTITVKPDGTRSGQRFNFYRDGNGRYYLQPTESINPLWQSDYAMVHFTYVPEGNRPYPGKDVFLFGQLNNYNLDDSAKMKYNAEKGVYETSLLLKQGYYDYMYVTKDHDDPHHMASFSDTEGDLWETENAYTILVYYRPLGGRADELIGYSKVNSVTPR